MSNLLEKASILLTPTANDDGKILSVKPMDGSGDFDFTRNSSATRVNSQGLIEDMQILSGNLVSNGDFSQEGPELVTNGDFATDTNWTKGTGWSISGGAASCDGTQTSNSVLVSAANLSLGSGNLFKITFNVSNYISGSLDIVTLVGTGGPEFTDVNANGSYTAYSFAASTGDGKIQFIANSDFIGSIDNVSVKEVGQDWTLGTDWGIGNNKAIRTGTTSSGLTQSGSFSLGKKFKLNFTITDWTTGSLQGYFYGGGGSDAFFSIVNIGNGTFTFETTTTINRTNISLYAFGSFDGSVSNISLIEITDDTNLPRIDYSPYSGAGTCGHWLFEPQSTNFAVPSDNKNNINLGDVQGTYVPDVLIKTPDNSNTSYKFTPTQLGQSIEGSGGSTNNRLYFEYEGVNTTYTNSIYVKSVSGNTFNFAIKVVNKNSDTEISSKTISVTDVWKRVDVTGLVNGSIAGARYVIKSEQAVNLWGFQIEKQSYATSYIPTSGSTVTRNQEEAFGSGNSSLINSTEGTLYAEIAALADNLTFRLLSLSDGTSNNRIFLGFRNSSNIIYAAVRSQSSTVLTINYSISDITELNKIAFKYQQNNFSLYVNGTEAQSITSGNVPIGLDRLNFDGGNGGDDFYGNVKCVAVFKEALTDDELECLTSDETSFSSFNALALANNYTII